MLLDPLSIDALKNIIIGDSDLTPYYSGPKLIELFNPYGFEDEYHQGLPENDSRSSYTLKRVKKINEDDNKMKKFLESIVDPRRYVQSENPLNVSKAVEAINSIIAIDGFKLAKFNGIYRLCNIDNSEEIGVNAVFEKIQAQILEEIESAEFLIWVAVAWFTDETLFNALVKKRQLGISVKIILIDDRINRSSSLDFRSLPTKWLTPESNYQNIMHHKFCVIDLKKVLHGSYNWTNKAKYNQENISVTKDRAFTEKFAKSFVQLAAI